MAEKQIKPKTSRSQKGVGRFQKGRSGNPKGRPLGSRNRSTLALEAMLEGEGVRLTRKAIEMGLAGNIVALRLCLERLVPVRHERPVSAELSELSRAESAAAKLQVIIEAVSAGHLLPSEGAILANLMAGQGKAKELDDLEGRVSALEQNIGKIPTL